MVDLSKIALAKQMLDSAEKSVQSARQLLLEVSGATGKSLNTIRDKAASLTATETGEGRIVEGVFDGMNMVGPDGKQYPVPANYASKSKLVEGDTLKLTILEDGSFVYKQIGPVERDKALGTLTQGDNGDEATIVVPKGGDSEWGAVENIIKKGASHEDAEKAEDLPETAPAHEILNLDDIKD